MTKLMTYKSDDFTRSAPYAGYLPRKDDIIMFPEGAYLVTKIIMPMLTPELIEVRLEKKA